MPLAPPDNAIASRPPFVFNALETAPNLYECLQVAMSGVVIFDPETHRDVSDTINLDIDKLFRALSGDWKMNRPRGVDIHIMAEHPAYQKIIDMRKQAVPLILNDLRKNIDFWFSALHEITGANPVSPEHEGKLRLMADDWIAWGISEGYIV